MLAQTYSAQTAYLKVRADTASSEETVVLLFDGIVRLLHEARDAMQQGHLEVQSRCIGRVQRILTELTCALDDTEDPTLVAALRCTYTDMYNRLSEANVKDDLAALDEVIELAKRFAQVWRTALQSVLKPIREVAAG